MRDEVIEKILMLLQGEEIDLQEIQMNLRIILNDYEIVPRETALVVRNEDKNRWFLQKFLMAKTVSGRSGNTLAFYQKQIGKILEGINKTADEITTDDIRYYLAVRQRRDKISKVTANNELRCLRTFYGFLLSEEMITKNPCLKIEPIKVGRIQKKAFTEMEVEKIRMACTTARETAMIEILLSTGCRVSELAIIKRKDIAGEAITVHGKGGKDRTVYLNAKASMALQVYLAERKDANPYLFCGGIDIIGMPKRARTTGTRRNEWYKDPTLVSKVGYQDKGGIESTVRKIGKRAGVEDTHPHRFRRTCATLALRRGMPIEQVSRMLGHEQIGTTQIYLDLSEEELRQAHQKYVV